MYYYDSYNILQKATTNVGASANTFKDNLNSLPNIGSYYPSVTLTYLDATGNVITDPTLAKGY